MSVQAMLATAPVRPVETSGRGDWPFSPSALREVAGEGREEGGAAERRRALAYCVRNDLV